MTFWTIPAWNLRAGRFYPLIGTMAGKRTSSLRMHRATGQTCILPGFLANVFLAGEPDLKSKLHRPQARTAATVAGLLFMETPPLCLFLSCDAYSRVNPVRKNVVDAYPFKSPSYPFSRGAVPGSDCRWSALKSGKQQVPCSPRRRRPYIST